MGEDASELKHLIEEYGMSDEQLHQLPEGYRERLEERRCMTCGGDTGIRMIAIFHPSGVLELYCSGICMQDMHFIGVMQEIIEDKLEAVKFRGNNAADEPEE